MKLSELLILRKDLTKEITRLQDRMKASLFFVTTEGFPDNTPEKEKKYLSLTEDLEVLYLKLEKLNRTIDDANRHIGPILVSIRLKDTAISFYTKLRKDMLEKIERHTTYSSFGERIKQNVKQSISLEKIETIIESLEQDRRNLDKKVQYYNWTTDIEFEEEE